MSDSEQKRTDLGTRPMRPGGPGFAPPGGGGGRFGMMMPTEKPKNFRKTFIRLAHYLQPHYLTMVIVLFCSVVGTGFAIYSPMKLGEATTIIFRGLLDKANSVPGAMIDFGLIRGIILLLIILYTISALFRYLEHFLMAGVAQRTVFALRGDVSEKVTRLPLKYFDSTPFGETLSRVTNDIETIGASLQQSIAQVIESVITIVGVLVMMIIISRWMTIIALITLPLSYIITKNITKHSQKHFAAQQKELGQLNGHVEEMYGGHLIVKAFNHEASSVRHFNIINERLYNAGWKAQFISGIIMPLLNFVNNIGYVGVAVIGGIFVTLGMITIGNVQAFFQYQRQFTHPIIQAANIANIFQSTVAAAERVFELLDEEEEIQDSENALSKFIPAGDVSFQNVKFGYNKDNILMHDLNICVESGQTVAIVGPTGAGKTTLVNLLMRFYEVDGGSILIDGIDIRKLKRGTLRNVFGMVLQDTWLFKGTIRDNIAYGKVGATEEEVVAAAQAAHIDYFIRTLPEGYDTLLNEEASNISAGQKQLLTIARAILADPAILILDEATSSVDTRTEILIQRAMGVLMKGRTNFVIAHRLSTIRDANMILVINNGEVVEKGTNAQLLAEKGFYADIYNSQFTNNLEQVG